MYVLFCLGMRTVEKHVNKSLCINFQRNLFVRTSVSVKYDIGLILINYDYTAYLTLLFILSDYRTLPLPHQTGVVVPVT